MLEQGVSGLFITIIICLIIIAIAAFVYIQDGTEFTKLTKYSFFDILLNNEARTLNAIYKACQHVQGEYRILVNVHVQDGTTVHKIPVVLVHESGIHIISTENKEGWIIGTDRMLQWLNVKYGNKQHSFENPILKNKRYMYALRDTGIELPEELFHQIVVFNDGCSFQKIEISTTDVEVMKQKELNNWAKSLVGQSLSTDEIQTVYDSLKGKMVVEKKAVVKKVKSKTA